MSELITLRKKKASKFYAVDLRIIENESLSWAAKGVWTYLISRPEGWKVNRADLLSRGKEKDSALRTIIKELESVGLLKIERLQAKAGKFAPTVWVVSEEPDFSHIENPQEEKPHVGQPHAENPHVENPHDLQVPSYKYLLTNTNVQKNESVSEELPVTVATTPSPSSALSAEKEFEQNKQPASLAKSTVSPKQPERKNAGPLNSELLNRLTAIPTVDIAQAKGLLVSYGEERVRTQLDYLPFRKANNPAASLRAALRNDWEAPTEYLAHAQLETQKQERERQIQALEEEWERQRQFILARREEEQRQRKAEEARWNALTPEQQQAEREEKARAHQAWLEQRRANNPLTAIRSKVFANCFGGTGK